MLERSLFLHSISRRHDDDVFYVTVVLMRYSSVFRPNGTAPNFFAVSPQSILSGDEFSVKYFVVSDRNNISKVLLTIKDERNATLQSHSITGEALSTSLYYSIFT